MTILDFYTSTPAQIYLKMKGFDNKKWEGWEQSRFIAYNVYASIPRKKGVALQSISKFFPLPTDKNNSVLKEQSEMQLVWDKIKNINNGK